MAVAFRDTVTNRKVLAGALTTWLRCALYLLPVHSPPPTAGSVLLGLVPACLYQTAEGPSRGQCKIWTSTIQAVHF